MIDVVAPLLQAAGAAYAAGYLLHGRIERGRTGPEARATAAGIGAGLRQTYDPDTMPGDPRMDELLRQLREHEAAADRRKEDGQ